MSETAAAVLKSKREELIGRFLSNKEKFYVMKNANLLDDFFFNSYVESQVGKELGLERNPYAIIALGGYGRSEQCYHSDIDLLFLFGKSIPAKAESLFREIVYPLWDIGFEVGHSIRTVKDCVNLANDDFEILNSILDGRFVCGISSLFLDVMEKLRTKIVKKKSKKIIKWFIDRSHERKLRFGDSTYRLEPNLKEGIGGLRDYHTLLWIARISSNVKQIEDLKFNGFLSHGEFNTYMESLNFIWNVRNRLHIKTGRKCDQLHFEHQIELAQEMGFTKKNGQQPVERFLGKLHKEMEILKQHHMLLIEQSERSGIVRLKSSIKRKVKVPGLVVEEGMIGFKSTKEIVKTPELLISIFKESSSHKLPLSAEARRIVKDFKGLVNDDFRSSPEVVAQFERILTIYAPKFNILNEMLRTGFLETFIPEFHSIKNRIQYNQYHMFPVDKHSLRTVFNIKGFTNTNDAICGDLCGNIYREIKRKKQLLWAALLHDIGKGVPDTRHAEAGKEISTRIMKRMGYPEEDVKTVSFLVHNHLFLIKIATRRDTKDEETAIFCARHIKHMERLKMLYILSVADSISTGPKAWNEWTSYLLRDLFFKILSVLKNGELASEKTVKRIEEKKELLLKSAGTDLEKEERERIISQMSPRYLLSAKPDDMLAHMELYKTLGDRKFVWKIEKSEKSGTRTITICGKDRPGFFSFIAGSLALNGIDILNAKIFTWPNNIALDIFKVNPPLDLLREDERWEKIEQHLESVFNGELDLHASMNKKRSVFKGIGNKTIKKKDKVIIDNTLSSFFTILEVFAYDYPGLLFRITDALYKCDVSIWVSQISTRIDQVVDVFYIRDINEEKIEDPEELEKIKNTIEEVLTKSAKEGSVK